MSNLVRRSQSALVSSDSSNTVSKGLVYGGVGTLGVVTLAAFIPLVGPVLLAVLMIVAGVLLYK